MHQAVGVWLTLVERASDAYPLPSFLDQATIVVTQKGTRPGEVPGYLADYPLIRRFTDNQPLLSDQQVQMLRILDILIDDGDRQSGASLLQSETFRSTPARS